MRKVTHKIKATPSGWQVENYYDGKNLSSARFKFLIWAKCYIWRYQMRLKKEKKLDV